MIHRLTRLNACLMRLGRAPARVGAESSSMLFPGWRRSATVPLDELIGATAGAQARFHRSIELLEAELDLRGTP